MVPEAAPPLALPMEAPTPRSQRALRQAASRSSLVLVEAPPLASPMNGRRSPRAPPPSRTLAGSAGGPGGPRGALERAEAEAAVRPETPEEDEDEEEALPHSEAVDVFQEGLAMVVQDPLLCDLPIQVRAARGPPGSFPAGAPADGRLEALMGSWGRAPLGSNEGLKPGGGGARLSPDAQNVKGLKPKQNKNTSQDV